jgi:hypothetical protein
MQSLMLRMRFVLFCETRSKRMLKCISVEIDPFPTDNDVADTSQIVT